MKRYGKQSSQSLGVGKLTLYNMRHMTPKVGNSFSTKNKNKNKKTKREEIFLKIYSKQRKSTLKRCLTYQIIPILI